MGFLTTFYIAGDNTKFTDFNTHCCPKIRLCGWQKASHFTLVFWIDLFTLTSIFALLVLPVGTY